MSLVAACRSVLQREGLQGAVFLYGSSLEQNFRSDSDVDLAVLDDSRRPFANLLESRLNQRPSEGLLPQSETLLPQLETLLPQSESLLLQSALNQLASECFLLESDLILLE